MSTRTQAYLLLLFGGALIRLAVSDLLLRYVRAVARPLIASRCGDLGAIRRAWAKEVLG